MRVHHATEKQSEADVQDDDNFLSGSTVRPHFPFFTQNAFAVYIKKKKAKITCYHSSAVECTNSEALNSSLIPESLYFC